MNFFLLFIIIMDLINARKVKRIKIKYYYFNADQFLYVPSASKLNNTAVIHRERLGVLCYFQN